MRIGVIEEVDEQLTLTSLKQSNDSNRPHVKNIFAQGPPPPSDPVDVPGGAQPRKREIFSRSAPTPIGKDQQDLMKTESLESDTTHDRRTSLRLVT